jgi:hypothetical protein
MASRYQKTSIVSNRSKYYEPLRRGRRPPYPYGNLVQFATPRLRHPTPLEKGSIPTSKHVWKYGDRFYKLAFQFYNNSAYWWVIAWFNQLPTESHVKEGMVIYIPIQLEDGLSVLGV